MELCDPGNHKDLGHYKGLARNLHCTCVVTYFLMDSFFWPTCVAQHFFAIVTLLFNDCATTGIALGDGVSVKHDCQSEQALLLNSKFGYLSSL